MKFLAVLLVVVAAVVAQDSLVRDKRSGILLTGGVTPAATVAVASPVLPAAVSPWGYPWAGAWGAPWARWGGAWASSWPH